MALCQEVAARASALLEDQGDRLVELVVIQVRLRVAEDQYLDYDAFLYSEIPIFVVHIRKRDRLVNLLDFIY